MADEENPQDEIAKEIPGGEGVEDTEAEEIATEEIATDEPGGADKPSGEKPTEAAKTEPSLPPTGETFVKRQESTPFQVVESIPEVTKSLLEMKSADKSLTAIPSKSGPLLVSSSVTGFAEARRIKSEKYNMRAKMALGSAIDIRKSMASDLADKRAVRYANTYKLESDNPFNPQKVDKILESVMKEALENLNYDREKCVKQVKWASALIRSKVKEMEFDRYKIISIVTIGEKYAQDVFVACRFLWDAEKDRYSFFSMENTYVYGIAMCFGLYYE